MTDGATGSVMPQAPLPACMADSVGPEGWPRPQKDHLADGRIAHQRCPFCRDRTRPRMRGVRHEVVIVEERPVAEREGFEPSIGLTLYTLSKRARSTTLPPLRISLEAAH